MIQTPNKNFNSTDPHWWNRFAPFHKPGSLCSSQNFTTGDTVTTTYSLFQWTIISPNATNLSASSVAYKGTNLDSCDVLYMGIDANIQGPSVSAYATIQCDDPQAPLIMRTSWSVWGADSSYDKQESRLDSSASSQNLTSKSGPASGLDAVNEI